MSEALNILVAKTLFSKTADFSKRQPPYSTNILAAWQLVQFMKFQEQARYRSLQLVAYSYNRSYATFDGDAFDNYHIDTWVEANGPHATPTAICMAALDALGVPRDEILEAAK